MTDLWSIEMILSATGGRYLPMRCVVVLGCSARPLLDQDLCFTEAVEDFPVQHFIAEVAVEAIAIATLPR